MRTFSPLQVNDFEESKFNVILLWAENFRRVDIEIHAWPTLFVYLKIILIFSLYLGKFNQSESRTATQNHGNFEILRAI